jgi:hypothetical protein
MQTQNLRLQRIHFTAPPQQLLDHRAGFIHLSQPGRITQPAPAQYSTQSCHTSLPSMLSRFKNQDTSTLTHHKAITLSIKWTAGSILTGLPRKDSETMKR